MVNFVFMTVFTFLYRLQSNYRIGQIKQFKNNTANIIFLENVVFIFLLNPINTGIYCIN